MRSLDAYVIGGISHKTLQHRRNRNRKAVFEFNHCYGAQESEAPQHGAD